jgi:hypothetical protein
LIRHRLTPILPPKERASWTQTWTQPCDYRALGYVQPGAVSTLGIKWDQPNHQLPIAYQVDRKGKISRDHSGVGESKIQSFPRLGGLHHRYAVAA